MAANPRYWRVRVRNAANSADVIVATTVPGGTNPTISAIPTGDGQSIDVVTGDVGDGSYSVRLADADTGGGVRIVTSQMTNAAGQYDKLARVTFLETSPDGSAWTPLIVGYLTDITFPTAIAAILSISDPLRVDRSRKIFVERSDAFPRVSNLMGTPVDGGWPGIHDDFGAWRMQVATVATGLVHLAFVRGATPLAELLSFNIRTSISAFAEERINAFAQPYAGFADDAFAPNGGYFPGLQARITTVPGGVTTYHTPVRRLGFNPMRVIYNGQIAITWTGTLPTVGDFFDVTVYPIAIGPANPLHWYGHPVDLVTALWTQAGILWDTTAAAAVKQAIGPARRVLLRITQSYTLAEFQKALFGYFGFNFRGSADGERELFVTRFRNAAMPSTTITINDLLGTPDQQPVMFKLSESSIVNVVTFDTLKFVDWRRFRSTDEPLDLIMTGPDIARYPLAGSDESKEARFTLPGTVLTEATAWTDPKDLFGDVSEQHGAASEILDRFGLGCPEGEFLIKDTVSVPLGEFITLDLSHQINGTVRGGQRLVQVVHPTPTASARSIRVLDAGSTAQAATVPTFTLAAGTTDPKAFFTATVTNAATILTGQPTAKVRVEFGTGASAPSANGSLLGVLPLATETVLASPRVDSGTRVWIRMRTEVAGKRPSAFSAWSDLNLTDLTAPSSLTRSGNILSWVNGEATKLVDVWYGTGGTADIRVITLPAGSVTFDLSTVVPAATAIITSVNHRDEEPYKGVSAGVTLSYTTPAATALLAPVGPTGGVKKDGTIVYEVTAQSVPSDVEIEMATETAVGSATPGTYERVATLPAVAGAPVRYVMPVPADKKLRYFRARSVADGFTSSGYSPVISVAPWSTVSLPKTYRANLSFVSAEGVDTGYAVRADDQEGKTMSVDVVQTDGVTTRSLVKGHTGVDVRNGDAVVFATLFQNIPLVLFRGGILHEPRAKWGPLGDGTESTAYDTTKPTYEDFAALDLSTAGFTVRARLRQKSGTTARTHNFAASNDIDVIGEFEPVTLSNAPAVDDKYTVHYSVFIQGDGPPGSVDLDGEIRITVAIDSSADSGSSWSERATRVYSLPLAGTQINGNQTWSHESVLVTVSGLDNTDKLRVRMKNIQTFGGPSIDSITVHAFDGTGDPSAGVTYNTASDQFASKTPDADDRVRVDAVAVA